MYVQTRFEQEMSETVHSWTVELDTEQRIAWPLEAMQGGESYSFAELPPTDDVTAELDRMGYELGE